LAAASIDALTHPELLSAEGELETLARQLPTQGHRMIARLAAEASPTDLGATCLRDVLTHRLRISLPDARRRTDDPAVLGPHTALTSEPLDPVLALTAAAEGDGTLGADHVRVIRGFFEHLPPWGDQLTREQAEATLVRVGTGLDPDALRTAAVPVSGPTQGVLPPHIVGRRSAAPPGMVQPRYSTPHGRMA
jgi:hypothetical protein